MYENRTPPQSPPCETCRVQLMEANRQAADIYLLVRDQVITAGEINKVVDISIPAIKAVMDIFNVIDQKACLMKIRRLFFAERQNNAG